MGARLSLNLKKREDTGERTRNHPPQKNRKPLDRQAGPAFCTASSQYFPAVLCAHSLPKAVLAFALQFRRLLIRKRHKAPLHTFMSVRAEKQSRIIWASVGAVNFAKSPFTKSPWDRRQIILMRSSPVREHTTLHCFGALLSSRRQTATGIPHEPQDTTVARC